MHEPHGADDGRGPAQAREIPSSAMLDAAADGIVAIDMDGVIGRINPAAARMLGYAAQELIGRHLSALIPGLASDDGSAMARLVTDAAAAASSTRELEGVRKDGTTLPLDVCISVGSVDGERFLIGVLRDASDRKAQERLLCEESDQLAERAMEQAKELARSEELLRRILTSAPAYIVRVDEQGTIEFVNRVPEEARREDVLGSSCFDYLPRGSRDEFRGRLEDVFRRGTIGELGIDVRTRSGGLRRYLVRFAPFLVEREVRSALLFISDLTQQATLERQLQQAQKMEAIGLLAGGIAHDFNNILTAILSFGRFVLDRLDPSSVEYEDQKEVITSAQRAADLTEQLLTFSRRRTVKGRSIDMNVTVAGLERMLARVLGENVALEFQPARDLWSTQADASTIEQLVVNLAINARDAMPDGGRLILRTCNVRVESGTRSAGSQGEAALPGDYVQLDVIDEGVGMDEATRARVFEPFFTTKALGRGTGLGLSTCYGIVKQAGGHIEISSELGVGTTVRVLLPRDLRAPVESSQSRSEPGSGHRQQVLVVEDEPAVRKALVRTLGRLGYEVLEAVDGASALAQFGDRRDVDLLLSDLMMPGMPGQQLAAELKARNPELRIAYMSGYSPDDADGRPLTPSPDAPLLRKPFTAEGVADVVRTALTRSG